MSDGNGGGMLGNLKFNTVGREDAAKEVLTPQIEPAVKMRNTVLALIALVGLAGLLYFGFKESGKDLLAPPKVDKKFDVPDHSAGAQ